MKTDDTFSWTNIGERCDLEIHNKMRLDPDYIETLQRILAKKSLNLFLEDVDRHHKQIRSRDARRKRMQNLHPFVKRLYKDVWDVSFDECLKKFGEHPICYLTGRPIDIHNSNSFHFDHVIPISRGGSRTIENMEIAYRNANLVKSDLTKDELIQICREVLAFNDA